MKTDLIIRFNDAGLQKQRSFSSYRAAKKSWAELCKQHGLNPDDKYIFAENDLVALILKPDYSERENRREEGLKAMFRSKKLGLDLRYLAQAHRRTVSRISQAFHGDAPALLKRINEHLEILEKAQEKLNQIK